MPPSDPTQQAARSNALELRAVQFEWPGKAAFSLSIAALQVSKGERLLVTGPSGCGKSTLLSLLCGIVHPRFGTVEVDGTNIAGLRGAAGDRFRAEHFGIIFQMFNLLPYGSILDNVLLPLSFAPRRRQRAGSRGPLASEAGRFLDRLGLPAELHGRKAANLSVGQQQRVAVARSLIGQPEIIIADEPTSALDKDRQAKFLTLLFEEADRAGASVVMVSHDETLVSAFDRTLAFDALVAPI